MIFQSSWFFLLLFFAGCANKETKQPIAPTTTTSTNEREEGIRGLFEKLTTDTLGSCGTFSNDFAETVKFLDNFPETEQWFTSVQVRGILENTFRKSRNFWASNIPLNPERIGNRIYAPIPTELVQTLLMFRFIRNAYKSSLTTTTSRSRSELELMRMSSASKQLMQLAKEVADDFQFNSAINKSESRINQFTNSKTHLAFLGLCTDMHLSGDCSSLVLRAYLGIFGFAMMMAKGDPPEIKTPWVPVIHALQILTSMADNRWSSNCKSDTKKNLVRLKSSATLHAIAHLLDEPTTTMIDSATPLTVKLRHFIQKLNDLDKELPDPNC